MIHYTHHETTWSIDYFLYFHKNVWENALSCSSWRRLPVEQPKPVEYKFFTPFVLVIFPYVLMKIQEDWLYDLCIFYFGAYRTLRPFVKQLCFHNCNTIVFGLKIIKNQLNFHMCETCFACYTTRFIFPSALSDWELCVTSVQQNRFLPLHVCCIEI